MDSLIKQKEIEIIKRAQNGSEKAFNTIFYKYKVLVESILLSYLKDEDEAKDLTNIVFLKIYNNLNKFADYNNFKGWIITLTKHVAIDYLRTIKKKTVSIDDTEKNIQVSAKDLDNIISSDMKDIYNDIVLLFDNLPELTSKVCKLYYIHNLTITQINKKYNVPLGTIKSCLHRGRKSIQKQLKLC